MNENPTQTAQILKVDVTGRVWTPRARREAVLDEFERSGMPATKFAEHIGVKYPTLASWVQKRRRQRAVEQTTRTAGKEQGSAGFQWVEAMAGGGEQGLMVHLPGGARIEVTGRSQVVLAAELLRALGTQARGARC